MPITLTQQTTVLPGHRIELIAPELPEGAQVSVHIALPTETEMIPAAHPNEATLALLDVWDAEDAAMTDEEAEKSAAEWQEMQARLDARSLLLRVPLL